MKTKTCPICDQKIKGNYCKTCHRFVEPVTYESDFLLNESRDGSDYFELQLDREKAIRARGATDLNDGHKDHPQVNRPKDRRIENFNGREMRTTEMPDSYSSQTSSGSRQNGYYGGGNAAERKTRGAAGVFVVVFVIILVVELIVSIISGMKFDEDPWGRGEDPRPAAVWEMTQEYPGNDIEGEEA